MLVLGLLIVSASAQQPCPRAASQDTGISHGTPVRVVGIHPDDPNAMERADLLDQDGVVSVAVQLVDECWYQGTVTLASGRCVEFDRVALQQRKKRPRPPRCPPGALQSDFVEGMPVRLAAVHPEDISFPLRCDVEGLRGWVNEVDSATSCWITGQVLTEDGMAYDFYGVSLVPDGGDERRLHVGRMAKAGWEFEILAVHPTDNLYPSREGLIGLTCTASEEMDSHQLGWFGGAATCADGGEYNFYKIALSLRSG